MRTRAAPLSVADPDGQPVRRVRAQGGLVGGNFMGVGVVVHHEAGPDDARYECQQEPPARVIGDQGKDGHDDDVPIQTVQHEVVVQLCGRHDCLDRVGTGLPLHVGERSCDHHRYRQQASRRQSEEQVSGQEGQELLRRTQRYPVAFEHDADEDEQQGRNRPAHQKGAEEPTQGIDPHERKIREPPETGQQADLVSRNHD